VSDRRLGLFGGTFDPPHNAHVALALAARDALQLDAVLWIPAGAPWQKARAVTPAGHREAMVRAAIDGHERFMLERIELEREGPSYTIDTVRALREREPGAQLFLVIGADQYAVLHTWRGWQELLGVVTPAVANRPGAAPPGNEQVQRVAHRVVPLPLLPVSATEIRARVARALPVDDMVPAAVASYIEKHALYRS
jgi:nicotinate-nucleotide adenylyltransferase